MHKRIAIGLIVLIFVLGVAIVFYHQYTDIQQLEKELADAEELEKHMNQQPAADNKPPRPARDGFEWEWHGDHWHEMPIAQSEPVPQNSARKQPPIRPAVALPTYKGPLTYHAELLKTNPAEALRLQTEERGHWAANQIPPFPPDDTEAQTLARLVYQFLYNDSIGKYDENLNSELMSVCDTLDAEIRVIGSYLDAYEHPMDARKWDLKRLRWPIRRSYVSTTYPSDYFPDLEDLARKAHQELVDKGILVVSEDGKHATMKKIEDK